MSVVSSHLTIDNCKKQRTTDNGQRTRLPRLSESDGGQASSNGVICHLKHSFLSDI
jgi:hypothetical protein